MKEIALIISILILLTIMVLKMGFWEALQLILSLGAISVIMAYSVYCFLQAGMLAGAL